MKKVLLAAAIAALTFGGAANAEDFPTRSMTMVIPFAAGGPTDVLGRVMAQRMGEFWARRSWWRMSAAPVA